MAPVPALEQLQQGPQEMAVLDDEGPCSWLELFGGALAVAREFGERGLEPGVHVAVLPGNNTEYFQVLLGAVLSGVWVTPLNVHLTATEIEYVLSDSEAQLLVIMRDSPDFNCQLPVWSVSRQRLGRSVGDVESTLAALQELMGGAPGGTLMYTSGTTGRPKGVKRSAAASVAATLTNWSNLGAGIGLDGSGCHLVTGPVYHAAPGLYALYDLLNGARVILMARWDSEACMALIEQHRVTHTHLVPTMFVRLLRQREHLTREYDLSSLTLVLHGAAPVAPQVKQAMIDWWGPILVEYWGASESGIITRVDSAAWMDHPGTVGLPLAQYQLTVRDDDFQPLPVAEIGILYARRMGVSRPFRYFKDAAKTESCYVGDWFTLGDMGWLDAQGYAYIADRRSNLIISGGVNIYPAEVESAIMAHPAVGDVVVIGVDDAEWGKRVHAIIEPTDPAVDLAVLEQSLRVFASDTLAAFKLPRSWEFVGQLPRYDSGKLYRNQL